MQYRRGDVVGLLVGLPAESTADADRQLIQDVLAVAGKENLDGADVVVAVRMHWWGSVWKRPLPGARGTLERFLGADNYDDARVLLRQNVQQSSKRAGCGYLDEFGHHSVSC